MAVSPCPALCPGGVVAVAQVTSTADKEHNWRQCAALVRQAAARGARAVFLPEGFDFIGDSPQQSLALAEPLDGDIVGRYRQLARECEVWLSLGGFHERGHDWDSTGRIYNCHLLLDSSGRLVAAYRKLHLFDAELPGGPALRESSFTNPGRELLPPIDTPVGKLGLAVCYDLRFPELAQALRGAGAQILTFPSAFTVPTGAAHWEVRGHPGRGLGTPWGAGDTLGGGWGQPVRGLGTAWEGAGDTLGDWGHPGRGLGTLWEGVGDTRGGLGTLWEGVGDTRGGAGDTHGGLGTPWEGVGDTRGGAGDTLGDWGHPGRGLGTAWEGAGDTLGGGWGHPRGAGDSLGGGWGQPGGLGTAWEGVGDTRGGGWGHPGGVGNTLGGGWGHPRGVGDTHGGLGTPTGGWGQPGGAGDTLGGGWGHPGGGWGHPRGAGDSLGGLGTPWGGLGTPGEGVGDTRRGLGTRGGGGWGQPG
uniref:Nitrilase 1 n=1 Tax=Corvus moneduloides TaxID=1196302 RepID=A0A8U7NXN5_CORMO